MSDAPCEVRFARSEDGPFLRSLFAATREAEREALSGEPAVWECFLDFQYRAFMAHVARNHPECTSWIVLSDGKPVGNLMAGLHGGAAWLVDVALLAECRGVGLGTALVRWVMKGAAREGVPLHLHAIRGGGAERLYRRLGFREEGGTPVHVQLVWTSSSEGVEESCPI